MILLHTSDWHLGLTFRGCSFREDQKCFIDEICGIIREKSVDALLLSGDVFDRGNPNAEGQELYDYAVTRICDELGCRMLIIAGNHDSSSRLDSCRNLLRKAGLNVEGKLRRDVACVEFEDTDIYMLPWFTTERARAEFPEFEDRIDSMQAAYQVVLDHVRSTFHPGKRHIVMSHAYIVGAETSVSDRTAVVGQAAAVDGSVFSGFDYAALGHIHGPQDISDVIHYCGSPMKYSFGAEERQQKRVTIINTADMACYDVLLSELHGRATVRGTYADLCKAENVTEELRHCYVRAEVTDIYVGLELAEKLGEIYPNLLEFSSRMYERDDSSVTMTIEELETQDTSPENVFGRFVTDILGGSVTEHQLEMLREAIGEYERREEDDAD